MIQNMLQQVMAVTVVLTMGLAGLRPMAAIAAPAAQDDEVGGLYFSAAITEDFDGGAGVVLLNLAGDGTVELSFNLMGEPTIPFVSAGEWTDNGDGTVTIIVNQDMSVTADGAEWVDADESEEILEIGEDGSLSSEEIILYPIDQLGDVELAVVAVSEDEGDYSYTEYTSEPMPMAGGPDSILYLYLYADTYAELYTSAEDGSEEVYEYGEWAAGDDGKITVTITGNDDGEFDEAKVIVFSDDGEGTLTAEEWDTDVYGDEGFSVTESYVSDTANDEETTTSETEVSDTVTFSSDFFAEGNYVSLTLFDDNTIFMTTLEPEGGETLIEQGEWVKNEDGTLTVTITGTFDEEYETPVEMVFEYDEAGTTITATEYDKETHPDGLELVNYDATSVDSSGSSGIDGAVYLSEMLTGGDDEPVLSLIWLGDDGLVQANTVTFDNKSAVVVEAGEWTDNEDGTASFSLSSDMTVDDEGSETMVDKDEAVEGNLLLNEDGTVTIEELELTYHPLTATGAGEEAASGEEAATEDAVESLLFRTSTESVEAGGIGIIAEFFSDGTGLMLSGFTADDSTSRDFAWAETSDGNIELTITTDGDGADLTEPIALLLQPNDDGTLTAIEFDAKLWGEKGFDLFETTEDEIAAEAEGSAAP